MIGQGAGSTPEGSAATGHRTAGLVVGAARGVTESNDWAGTGCAHVADHPRLVTSSD